MKNIIDDRGSLFVCHTKEIPFEVVRIYTITFNKIGTIRGNHSHINLKQRLICVQGGIKVEILYQDGTEEVYPLGVGDFIDIYPKQWRKLIALNEKSVALVLCDQPYSPEDYIDCKTEFFKC